MLTVRLILRRARPIFYHLLRQLYHTRLSRRHNRNAAPPAPQHSFHRQRDHYYLSQATNPPVEASSRPSGAKQV